MFVRYMLVNICSASDVLSIQYPMLGERHFHRRLQNRISLKGPHTETKSTENGHFRRTQLTFNKGVFYTS